MGNNRWDPLYRHMNINKGHIEVSYMQYPVTAKSQFFRRTKKLFHSLILKV